MSELKILVTGAAGFIGSNLTNYLVQDCGRHVLAYDSLTYAGNLASIAHLQNHDRFQFVHADICDQQALDNTFSEFQPDSVMHLAAESHVDRSIDGPDAFIKTNVVGTLRLLQAVRKHYQQLDGTARDRFRFLHVSTDEVYGSLAPDDPPFTEQSPYDPHSPYSASKASSDHLVRAWHDTYGLPTLITNCSNNYGPFQFPEKLIPVVILKCLAGEPIPVYGDGTNVRDWLYVEDHCRALETVLVRGKVGETYNVGGNNELRNIDLVRLLCSLMDELSPETIPDQSHSTRPASGSIQNKRSPRPVAGRGAGGEGQLETSQPRSHSDLITFVTDRPGHDFRYAIDCSKLSQELGWHPQETAETGFRQTVQWYLDNRDWWQPILSGDYRKHRLCIQT